MLVASGGLGGDVAGLLRAAARPGSELALRLLTGQRHVRRTIGALARARPTLGDVDDVLRVYGSLAGAERGQRVSSMNRPPTAAQTPTLFVWCSRDPTRPLRHALHAHELIPGNRRAILPEAGHFPHRHDPARFAELLLDFVHGVDRTAVRPARAIAA
jgi:pimeloyl-ACP methyl ester carboxylesterase